MISSILILLTITSALAGGPGNGGGNGGQNGGGGNNPCVIELLGSNPTVGAEKSFTVKATDCASGLLCDVNWGYQVNNLDVVTNGIELCKLNKCAQATGGQYASVSVTYPSAGSYDVFTECYTDSNQLTVVGNVTRTLVAA